jgi:hypothetical protein
MIDTKSFLSRRAIAASKLGCEPQTSELFQADMVREIMANRASGRGIIEVGCYTGGTSVVLAALCAEMNWPLYVIDTHEPYVDFAVALAAEVSANHEVIGFAGTFQDFVATAAVPDRLNTIFIDANHIYEYARGDLETALRLGPRLVALHDYSLRAIDGTLGVDRAVHTLLGADVPIIRIGHQIGEAPQEPNSFGHYWEPGGSEGIVLDLDCVGVSAF